MKSLWHPNFGGNNAIRMSSNRLVPGATTYAITIFLHLKPPIAYEKRFLPDNRIMLVFCYSRIDFDEFSFDQPTKKDGTSAYTCTTDLIELKLYGLPPVGLPLSLLCGTLTGQHCKSLSFSLRHRVNFGLVFEIRYWRVHSLCVDQRSQ